MSNVTFLHKKLFFFIITSILCLSVLDYQPVSAQNDSSNRNNSSNGTQNNQDSDTNQPKKDSDTNQPKKDSDTNQPKKDSDTNQPKKDSDTNQPKKDSDTNQPKKDSDTNQPKKDSDTNQPKKDSDTNQPKKDSDTNQPKKDAQTDPFCPSGKYETPPDNNNPLLTISIRLPKSGQWLNSAYQPQKFIQPIGLIFQKQGKLTIVYKDAASSPVYRDVTYELCQDNIEKVKRDGIKDISNFGKMGINIKLDESRSINTIFEIKTDAKAKPLSLQMELLKLKSGQTRPEKFTPDRSVFFKPLPFNLDFVTLP